MEKKIQVGTSIMYFWFVSVVIAFFFGCLYGRMMESSYQVYSSPDKPSPALKPLQKQTKEDK